jgi:hypothetical protein
MARGERSENHPSRKVGREPINFAVAMGGKSYNDEKPSKVKKVKMTEVDENGKKVGPFNKVKSYKKPMGKQEEKDSWSNKEYEQNTGKRRLPDRQAVPPSNKKGLW